jgi:hypothetical protein
MEIGIQLDRVDPPAGRLWIVGGADPGPTCPDGPGPDEAGEIGFTGWLGLLRALYEATGASGGQLEREK